MAGQVAKVKFFRSLDLIVTLLEIYPNRVNGQVQEDIKQGCTSVLFTTKTDWKLLI